MRDDFPEPIKRRIAARAGYQCSRPECGASTAGPQLDSRGALNVGVAAHIHAASEGGPRFLPEMSTEKRSGAENGVWLCQTCGKLVDNDPTRFTAAVLRDWKQKAETAALSAIGKTKRTPRTASTEAQIRRNLKIRARLEKAMLRPLAERRQLRNPRPMDKFRSRKVVVRSLEDTKYPEVDVDPPSGISSWLVFEPYDFYHCGLIVILSIRLVVINPDQKWAYLHYALDVPEGTPGIAKVWVLAEIPWRNIREIDPDGDGYYGGPHLFCAYADKGTPYERIVARVIDDYYDSPLDPAKQGPDVKSLAELKIKGHIEEPQA
jgi:hypothetical protein